MAYRTLRLSERGAVHALARRDDWRYVEVPMVRTVCGRLRVESDAWAAPDTVSCRACLNRLS